MKEKLIELINLSGAYVSNVELLAEYLIQNGVSVKTTLFPWTECQNCNYFDTCLSSEHIDGCYYGDEKK